MRSYIALALLLSGCHLAEPMEVLDGDTYRQLGTTYRLARIDAPEMPGHCRPERKCVRGNPFASQEALGQMLAQKDVWCKTIGTDVYYRRLVECFDSTGYSINNRMVEKGYAEWYRRN